MNVGEKFLITTDEWFFAPDGKLYRAAHGTVHGIIDSTEALGIKTNAKSTNWYVRIGNMIIAGCQIHYVIASETCSFEPDDSSEIDYEGKRLKVSNVVTRIYDADSVFSNFSQTPGF